jgi:hypothetical protein
MLDDFKADTNLVWTILTIWLPSNGIWMSLFFFFQIGSALGTHFPLY